MPIYLDNNATTMLDPRVREAMLPYWCEQYANPSSVHFFGQQARHAVETAREQVASALGARPDQIVFTSGGTEANDLAIRGALAAQPDRRHIITTRVEHDSVLRLIERLETQGYRVSWLEVDRLGRLDAAAFEAAIQADTALATIMHANNETGVLFDIARLAEIAEDRGVLFHTDATQTVGKLAVNLEQLPVSMLTLAAHKFHGPKGVGALYLRRGTRIRPQMLGGHQERDFRAGTENVAGIVGLSAALGLAMQHLEDENTRVRELRDHLEAGIVKRIERAHVVGDPSARLPNTASIGFEGLQAEAVLMLLSNEGICASSGSACSSGSLEPSHVLQAMGIPQPIAHGAVRFSLSRFTTGEEIEQTLDALPAIVQRLGMLQPGETPVKLGLPRTP